MDSVEPAAELVKPEGGFPKVAPLPFPKQLEVDTSEIKEGKEDAGIQVKLMVNPTYLSICWNEIDSYYKLRSTYIGKGDAYTAFQAAGRREILHRPGTQRYIAIRKTIEGISMSDLSMEFRTKLYRLMGSKTRPVYPFRLTPLCEDNERIEFRSPPKLAGKISNTANDFGMTASNFGTIALAAGMMQYNEWDEYGLDSLVIETVASDLDRFDKGMNDRAEELEQQLEHYKSRMRG